MVDRRRKLYTSPERKAEYQHRKGMVRLTQERITRTLLKLLASNRGPR